MSDMTYQQAIDIQNHMMRDYYGAVSTYGQQKLNESYRVMIAKRKEATQDGTSKTSDPSS